MEYTCQPMMREMYSAIIYADFDLREVCCRNPACTKHAVNERAFAFKFFDQLVAKVHHNGKEHVLKSELFSPSPHYYPGGKKLSLTEVRERGGLRFTFLNMKTNQWEYVVEDRYGGFRNPSENPADDIML